MNQEVPMKKTTIYVKIGEEDECKILLANDGACIFGKMGTFEGRHYLDVYDFLRARLNNFESDNPSYGKLAEVFLQGVLWLNSEVESAPLRGDALKKSFSALMEKQANAAEIGFSFWGATIDEQLRSFLTMKNSKKEGLSLAARNPSGTETEPTNSVHHLPCLNPPLKGA